MYSEEDIASAIAAGVLTVETAEALRRHVAQLRSAPAIDEEQFRLITGFNDVFVVIACLLLLGSVAWIGNAWAHWLGAAAGSASAWALAEFFTRNRRMALPSIVLLLVFVGGILLAGVLILGKSAEGLMVASALTAAGTYLHWRRFHVPVTVAAGAAAVIGLIITALIAAVPAAQNWTTVILLVAGIAMFALAMRWGAADTARQTRKSDVAFWLHLLAAPLLVHPVFASLGVFAGETNMAQAIAVVVLYMGIAVISLVIDRRALMVSALIYVLYTFSELLKLFGAVSLGFALTALTIGSAMLLLSAFWHASRVFVLKRLPIAFQERLAPLH